MLRARGIARENCIQNPILVVNGILPQERAVLPLTRAKIEGPPMSRLIAFDTATGKPLWHYAAGGNIADAPMSYSVDGRRYVAIGAGNVLYAFALEP